MVMKQLSKNWLTENLIDLEYKQYVLLAYLEEVSGLFNRKMLYPSLSDLIDHYRNLKRFRAQADSLYQSFKESLESVDPENFRLSYQKVVEDDALMKELEQIVDFSLPHFEEYLQKGREIYEYVEKQLSIEPVGLIPLNADAGYLFIELATERATRIYEYSVSLFSHADEKLRGIHIRYVKTRSRSSFETPQSLKIELIRENRYLPNPSTYIIQTNIQVPFEATCLPIAKRMLLKQLAI